MTILQLSVAVAVAVAVVFILVHKTAMSALMSRPVIRFFTNRQADVSVRLATAHYAALFPYRDAGPDRQAPLLGLNR